MILERLFLHKRCSCCANLLLMNVLLYYLRKKKKVEIFGMLFSPVLILNPYYPHFWYISSCFFFFFYFNLFQDWISFSIINTYHSVFLLILILFLCQKYNFIIKSIHFFFLWFLYCTIIPMHKLKNNRIKLYPYLITF